MADKTQGWGVCEAAPAASTCCVDYLARNELMGYSVNDISVFMGQSLLGGATTWQQALTPQYI